MHKRLTKLTVGDFDVSDLDNAIVRARASVTKNAKESFLPIRRDVAELLAENFRGKLPTALAFKMPTRHNSSVMVQADLAEAGLPYRDDNGNVFDFHALRGQFVTSLALNNVPLVVAQKLARHSRPELTANHYTRLTLTDLRGAVETLAGVEEEKKAEKAKEA